MSQPLFFIKKNKKQNRLSSSILPMVSAELPLAGAGYTCMAVASSRRFAWGSELCAHLPCSLLALLGECSGNDLESAQSREWVAQKCGSFRCCFLQGPKRMALGCYPEWVEVGQKQWGFTMRNLSCCLWLFFFFPTMENEVVAFMLGKFLDSWGSLGSLAGTPAVLLQHEHPSVL